MKQLRSDLQHSQDYLIDQLSFLVVNPILSSVNRHPSIYRLLLLLVPMVPCLFSNLLLNLRMTNHLQTPHLFLKLLFLLDPLPWSLLPLLRFICTVVRKDQILAAVVMTLNASILIIIVLGTVLEWIRLTIITVHKSSAVPPLNVLVVTLSLELPSPSSRTYVTISSSYFEYANSCYYGRVSKPIHVQPS